MIFRVPAALLLGAWLVAAMFPGTARAQEDPPPGPGEPGADSALRTLTSFGIGDGPTAPSISAQEIVEVEKGVYRLTGYADIEAAGIRLQADEVIYDSNAETARARGNVVLIQGEGSLSAERMEMNLETGEATLWEVQGYTPPYYRFRAGRMERINAELFWIYDAVFTTCTQPVPYWSFKVKKARIRLEHYARLHGATFRNNNVPWLYIPTMLWPVKQERASGMLMPQVGSTAERGFYIGNAYYWAMRRNMDSTFYLDYFSKANFAGGMEYRYVPNERGKGRFIGYILPHDVDPEGSKRWFYHFDADQELGTGWRLLADVNGVSDSEFYRDFERDFNVATRPAEFSTIYATKGWSYYTLDLRTERNVQFFSSGDVLQQRLPEVEIRARNQQLGNTPLYLSFLGSANGLAREEPGLVADYQRLDLGATLSAQLSPVGWMDITPSLSIRDTYYTQQLDLLSPTGVSDEALNRTNVVLGVNILGPTFSRIFEPKPGTKRSRFKNSFEPRFIYTYIPDFPSRGNVILYDEIDTIPTDVNFLTYSMTSRVLRRKRVQEQEEGAPPEYESASEIASVELVQSVSFNNDLSDSLSLGKASSFGPVTLIGRYNPTDLISADLRMDYDILFGTLRAVTLSTNLSSPDWGHAYLSYFIGRNLEIPDSDTGTLRLGGGSAFWRDKFSFDVDLAYDLGNDFLQSQRYRIGYQTQCCGFTLEYLKNEFVGRLDQNEQFRFTVSLQGIGTFLDLNQRVN